MSTTVEAYTVGWFCAIPTEYVAACELLDEEYSKDKTPKINTYGEIYTFGRIEEHHVVVACLPKGRHGITSTAILANNMQNTFPNLSFGLMVGIAGGAPSESHDIRLGDVVVSSPSPSYGGGVVQYDFGKAIQNYEFEITSHTTTIPRSVLNAMSHLEALHRREGNSILATVEDMLRKNEGLRSDYERPLEDDKLYISDYVHPIQNCNCEIKLNSLEDILAYPHGPTQTGQSSLVVQRNIYRFWGKHLHPQNYHRWNKDPTVHYGLVASANTLMKDAILRDILAQKYGVLCFEMEAAGLSNTLPCVVIRGICDYSDSHKNDRWQGWAAANAAAYAKELLSVIPARQVSTNLTSVKEAAESQVYVLPALQNRRFVGREEKLAELEDRLFHQQYSDRCAVFGLGGIGKTQLTLQFCYMIKQKYQDRSIFWVSALSSSRFKQDCITIARKTALKMSENEEDSIIVVQEYLNSDTSGKWLLVVDNADDESVLFKEDIHDKLPQNENGLILFTTRHKEIAVDLAQGNIVALEELSVTEAEEFLSKSLQNKGMIEDRTTVKELLKELTYLPLAIAQASSYILKTSITISKYLELMRSTEEELVALLTRDFRDFTRDKEAKNAIAITWLISFQQIKKEDPRAADLLSFMAVVENKSIPFSMLPTTGQADSIRAIGTLIAYSFLTKQEPNAPVNVRNTGYDEIYDMHRLVHRSVKFWIQSDDTLATWKEHALSHLANICPLDVWENRDLSRLYEPHIIRLLRETKPDNSRSYADLCLNFGRCLRIEGRIQEAIHFISESVAWRTQWLPSGDATNLISRNVLAKTRISAAKLQTQCGLGHLLSRRVADSDLLTSSAAWKKLHTVQILSRLQDQHDEFKKALRDMDYVTAIADPIFAEDLHDHLICPRDLARKYHSAMQNRSATKILEDFEEEDAAQDRHAITTMAASKAVMNTVFSTNCEDAVRLLEDIVASNLRELPIDHLSALQAQHSLAVAYLCVGLIHEAIDILEKVVHISERALKPDDDLKLSSQHALASAYLHPGLGNEETNVEKAIALLEEVVAIQATKLNEDDPDRLISKYRLAQAYVSSGRHVYWAIRYLKSNLAQRAIDPSTEADPDILTIRYRLAQAYVQNGEIHEAIAVMQEIVEIEHRNREPGHPYRIKAEAWLTWMYAKQVEEKEKGLIPTVSNSNMVEQEKPGTKRSFMTSFGVSDSHCEKRFFGSIGGVIRTTDPPLGSFTLSDQAFLLTRDPNW